MSAPARAGKLDAPGWETEFGDLLAQVTDLPPAARHAVAQVVRSVLAEGVLEPEAVKSAVALLEELEDPTGASRRAQAARQRAAELRAEARALKAQAVVQQRRAERIGQALHAAR